MEEKKLAEVIETYLGCPCRYFRSLKTDRTIMAAYKEAKKRSKTEGFVPILVVVDDVLLESFILNSSGDMEEEYDFDMAKVADYRKKMLETTLVSGNDLKDKLYIGKVTKEEEENIYAEMLNKIKIVDSIRQFSGYWDYSGEKTYPLLLAEVPVKNPWEVFAWVPFGNWNSCPDTPELMAISKYWYEKYGAFPAVITKDVLEYDLEKPVKKEQAIQLVMEHNGFCSDNISSGPEYISIGEMAAMLTKATKWFFWWD